MEIGDLKVGDRVHLVGWVGYEGPVTEVKEHEGMGYAKYRCAMHKRVVGWLRFDQILKVD